MRAEASAVAAPPVALELDLDVFDGPFDLLVTLILRDEIDIWEVRVSRIIAEYVLKLADSGEFDLDATSQFVVLVAALLEMKSRLLLEEEVEEELEDLDPDEAARQLLERLVRYSQYRNAAGSLREAWEAHSGTLYRAVPVPAELLRRKVPDGAIPPSALADALTPLLREPPVPDTSHLADLAVSLVKELRRLRLILEDEGEFTFAGVAPARPPRARGDLLRPARAALQRRGQPAPDPALRRHRGQPDRSPGARRRVTPSAAVR